MSNPLGDKFAAEVRKLTDDAFTQGAATALRVARDGLAKAASSKFDNALTAHEIVVIMNDLVKVTTEKK
jgi:2-phospho-L-lactate guanylyltransferase (CobY/MobA/RfbA family)